MSKKLEDNVKYNHNNINPIDVVGIETEYFIYFTRSFPYVDTKKLFEHKEISGYDLYYNFFNGIRAFRIHFESEEKQTYFRMKYL